MVLNPLPSVPVQGAQTAEIYEGQLLVASGQPQRKLQTAHTKHGPSRRNLHLSLHGSPNAMGPMRATLKGASRH